MNSKKLFLLDAYALIYRAYFAFAKNPLINSKGHNVSAITGFTNTLLDLMEKEKPTHLAVVFDMAGPTDRAVEHEFYKANRQETPEDIRSAIPYIQEIIRGFHIPILGLEGYEADDVIGTVAKQKSKEGYVVYMVTPDKDFCQLVEENILIYKPGRQGNSFEILGVNEVKEKWEVENPLQVIDILGMWGDAVDNIPGIPGVGEKTAKKLIGEYGSMENVIANAKNVKGKVGENIANFAEQGIISKKLATIIIDSPIDVSDEDLLITEPDREKLKEIFTELEFRTIGRRVLGEDFSVNNVSVAPSKKTAPTAQMDLFGGDNQQVTPTIAPVEKPIGKSISNTTHEYKCVQSDEDIHQLISLLENSNCFCFDTETTGLDTHIASIVGLSFCVNNHEAYYIPTLENTDAILQKFKSVFENEKINKVGQNIKYDMLMLMNYNIEVKGALYDTMLLHYLLEPDMRHGMNFMAETYLGYTPVSIESLIGKKGKGQLSMKDIELDKITEYAAEDADITWQLYNYFMPKIKEREVLELNDTLEAPLIPVLAHMEKEGVQIDTEFLKKYSDEMQLELNILEKDIYEIAGVQFNLDSPKQLGEVLFDKLKIPYTEKKTATGQYSTNEETLSKIDHEIVKHLLDYRELTKLKSTYVDALPLLINPKTNRLHTTFNQTIAATGRLSSVNPNLQNIPIRSDRGKKIRQAFIPRNEDYVILSADYSQIELRIIAAMSNEENMIQDFINGLDIHTATAAKVYGISIDEVSKTQRSNAKMVNFGIIYAISAFGLSQRLSIPRKEASSLIENYFIQYPRIKEYMNETLEFAKTNGYVKTILGRRRYLKDINSANHTVRSIAEREAINAPIQGSAADMIKVAMIHIHDELKKRNLKTKMTLQVHDELVFDTHKSEIEEVKAIIIDKMQSAITMNVPIIAEVGVGDSWLEAH
jgi:DNA polymerase-1